MKLRCTLLNTTIPTASTTHIKAKLYPNCAQLKVPCPKVAYLNVSTMDVTGFNAAIHCLLGDNSLKGYIMGVAYIHNCTKKEKRFCKSLYFVVIEETIIPKPSDNPANIKIKTGVNRI